MRRICLKRQYNSTAVGFPIRNDQRAFVNRLFSAFVLAGTRTRSRVYEKIHPFSLVRSWGSLSNFLHRACIILLCCRDDAGIVQKCCRDIAWIVLHCLLWFACGSLGNHLQILNIDVEHIRGSFVAISRVFGGC